jgi:predicted RNase H-like nuclease
MSENMYSTRILVCIKSLKLYKAFIAAGKLSTLMVKWQAAHFALKWSRVRSLQSKKIFYGSKKLLKETPDKIDSRICAFHISHLEHYPLSHTVGGSIRGYRNGLSVFC